jgi:phospholipid/cholesterol/gamma-HCH transport system permease protein
LSKPVDLLERLGRATVRGVDEMGFGATLFGESLFWLFMGPSRKQPVRISAVIGQMMEIGIRAVPIISVLSATIGIMLAIQGIYTLKWYGAESRVVMGIAMSVVREFSPLITGILVAGRSGSALAARLGTMRINQEIDALQVMGISPVRFLVVPALLAMVVMVPALTMWSNIIALSGAGLYCAGNLDMTLGVYFQQVVESVRINDLYHGLGKSLIFGVLITMVGVVNGALVTGGAEGVGRMTTRSVVHAISAIVITDMLFVFMVTR